MKLIPWSLITEIMTQLLSRGYEPCLRLASQHRKTGMPTAAVILVSALGGMMLLALLASILTIGYVVKNRLENDRPTVNNFYNGVGPSQVAGYQPPSGDLLQIAPYGGPITMVNSACSGCHFAHGRAADGQPLGSTHIPAEIGAQR